MHSKPIGYMELFSTLKKAPQSLWWVYPLQSYGALFFMSSKKGLCYHYLVIRILEFFFAFTDVAFFIGEAVTAKTASIIGFVCFI